MHTAEGRVDGNIAKVRIGRQHHLPDRRRAPVLVIARRSIRGGGGGARRLYPLTVVKLEGGGHGGCGVAQLQRHGHVLGGIHQPSHGADLQIHHVADIGGHLLHNLFAVTHLYLGRLKALK